MSLHLLVIVSLLCDYIAGQSNKYCPSDSWVECAAPGGNCHIPPTVKAATVSFGAINCAGSENVNGGKWIFSEITNIDGQTELIFKCAGGNMGNTCSNTNKGCCYNIKEQNGPSTNDQNWQFLASHNQIFTVQQPTYIRYGIANKYSYRWMEGTFNCRDSAGGQYDATWFINVNPGESQNCWAFKNSSLPSKSFIECGDQKGSHTCNLAVTGNGGSAQLVKYGSSQGNHNFVYSYMYAQNAQIDCTNAQFGNANPKVDSYCSILNATAFVGAQGYWTVSASCGGESCIINDLITEGVTSTTTQSCTQSWTKSLSYTVSGSLSFLFFSKSESLTKSQSEKVSSTVSSSYSQHTSKTCGAICGNGSAGQWTLYQWIMTIGEYIGPDIVPFNVDCCYYICTTSTQPPKCPPTYCTPNTQCQNCTGYP
eukprot:87923_1